MGIRVTGVGDTAGSITMRDDAEIAETENCCGRAFDPLAIGYWLLAILELAGARTQRATEQPLGTDDQNRDH